MVCLAVRDVSVRSWLGVASGLGGKAGGRGVGWGIGGCGVGDIRAIKREYEYRKNIEYYIDMKLMTVPWAAEYMAPKPPTMTTEKTDQESMSEPC